MRVGKFVFGPEPTDAEFYQWVSEGCPGLCMRDTCFVDPQLKKQNHSLNPKRALRKARLSLELSPKESSAQAALRQSYEQFKKASKKSRSQKKKILVQEKFELKKQKRKEKRKGR